MAEGRPPNVRSLNARLRNHCRDTGRDEGRARRHISALVVAQMLSDTETVVKGGRNLEIRYGLRASRASSDLDLVRGGSVAGVIDRLEDALEQGWEGFQGRVTDRGPIAAPVPDPYVPHRLEVSLTYQGRSGVGRVVLELAAEEIDGLQQPDVVASKDGIELFTAVGLPAPGPVAVLNLPVQIAQKLHACTTPDAPEQGWTNDRAHDLVDLQLLARDLGEGRLAEVREAATRRFASRRRHPWPPEVTVREGWAERYVAELDSVSEADLLPDVHAAARLANRLIGSLGTA